MSDVDENRKHLLAFIDLFREAVEKAVDLEGDWKVEKPNLYPIYETPLPSRWGGMNHTRFTLAVNLIDPRPSSPSARDDDSKEGEK